MLTATAQAPNPNPISIWKISLLKDLTANYSTCGKSSGTMIQMMHILFNKQHNIVLLFPQIHWLWLRGSVQVTAGTQLATAIAAEKLDEFGNPTQSYC
jgi:hypothetical protein